MDSFLKKRTLESECEDPKDDTSDALVVLESKRPNPGFGVEGVNDIASSLAESPFQPNLMLYPTQIWLKRTLIPEGLVSKSKLVGVFPKGGHRFLLLL